MIIPGSPLNCGIPDNSFDSSGTFDCDSRMHSFLLLYSLAVLLLVILPLWGCTVRGQMVGSCVFSI